MPLYIEAADETSRRHRISAKRYVRLRVHTRPGSLLSLVVTESGGWRLAEQHDPEARLRLLARGQLPSGVVEDDMPWDRRR